MAATEKVSRVPSLLWTFQRSPKFLPSFCVFHPLFACYFWIPCPVPFNFLMHWPLDTLNCLNLNVCIPFCLTRRISVCWHQVTMRHVWAQLLDRKDVSKSIWRALGWHSVHQEHFRCLVRGNESIWRIMRATFMSAFFQLKETARALLMKGHLRGVAHRRAARRPGRKSHIRSSNDSHGLNTAARSLQR